MKQPLLFTQKQLGKISRPKEKRDKKVKIWQTWDLFPFGRFKGQPLSTVAQVSPTYLEWWKNKSKVQLSSTLIEIINQTKYLSL
jgi:hypothetical protein